MDIEAWLGGLGLQRYAAAFRDNLVDAAVLPTLTGDDLKDLGVAAVGDRRKLLNAIAALADGGAAPVKRAPAPQGPQREAELRQLTVVFVDLVGSTELSARLEPEEAREVLRAYQEAVAGEIARFGGHVAQYLGDGVVAYFGWPTAHEDGAEQAVRAGLAAPRAVRGLGAPPGRGPLGCRVGVATGQVLVGDLVGEDPAPGRGAVGETPNRAARLQQAAAPGQVVVDATTRRLVGTRFELADLGALPLKGLGDGVRAWAALREIPAEGRFEALHARGRTHELVGRGQELALLLERWRLACAGDGQVVVLSGEPGIGKSRVVLALREGLRGGGRWVGMRLQCSAHHAHSALWPVIGLLERAAGLERDAPAETRRRKLAGWLARSVPEAWADLPLFAELLGLPAEEGRPPPDLSPRQKKRRVFDALLAHVEAMARRQPVLIVLEDAQWLDPTTRELFDAVVEAVARLPALLVVTARPEAQLPWAGHGHATALTLNRLVGRQAEALATLVAGGKRLPDEVLGQIRARTDGVPLFVEELTKAVVESGLLRDAGDRLDLEGPLPPRAIPTTLHDSLMARLDRVAAVKEVAQAAACIGRRFAHDLLAAVAPLPEGRLLAALDQLVVAGLVSRRGAPPEAVYAFKHSLVQEAAYGSMLKARRRRLHAELARALEERFADEGNAAPEVVAHHLTEAGLPEAAAGWWLKAAELAEARSAMVEATAASRRALDLLACLPRTEARLRQQLAAQAGLGRALITTRGQAAPETGQAFDAALALAKELGASDEAFDVLAGVFVYRMVRADLGDALAVAERMLAAARASGDAAAALMAHRCLGVARFYLGEHEAARRDLERAVGLYRDGEHAPLAQRFAFDPKAAALGYLGICLLVLGRVAEARRRFAEALEHARVLSHPVTWANTLAHVGLGRIVAGDGAGVRATAEALGQVAAEQGFPYWTAHAAVQRGWLLLASREGLSAFQEGIAVYRASGARMAVPTLLAMQAEAHLHHGEAGKASALLEEARRLAAETGERWYEPEILRLSGEAAAAAGRPEEAEAELRGAERLAERHGARLWRDRALDSLERVVGAGRRQRDRAPGRLVPSP